LITRTPTSNAISVAAVFVLTAMVFVVYDISVPRRQTRLLSELVERSHHIVVNAVITTDIFDEERMTTQLTQSNQQHKLESNGHCREYVGQIRLFTRDAALGGVSLMRRTGPTTFLAVL
jgi:hypothetical protein